jgi:hypothetical protein
MSLFRALLFMPFIVPVIGIASLGYIAMTAATGDGGAGHLADEVGDSAGYSRVHRYEHGDRTLIREVATRNDCGAIDGDTLRCGPLRVRLLGIDAAELPGHCAIGRHCAPGDPFAQKQALAGLTRGTLSIKTITIDRYGRSVADVTTSNGTDLSCAMLAAGASYVGKWDNGDVVARRCPQRALSGF